MLKNQSVSNAITSSQTQQNHINSKALRSNMWLAMITKHWSVIFLIFFVIIGYWFRISGISTNHSFWADEAFTAGLARDLATGNRSVSHTFSILGYQNLHLVTMALFIKLFGISEWSARLPSVIWGTLGIIAAFLLTRKLSNHYGAIIATFVYAVLQLNLAYSTQARPYSAIQTLLIGILIALYYYFLHKKPIFIVGATVLVFISVYYHYLAILYVLLLVPMYIHAIYTNRKKISISTWTLLGVFLFFFLFIWGKSVYVYLIKIISQPFFTNNITFVRELFYKQFGFMTLPALFGGLYIFTKKQTKLFMIGIFLWSGALFYLWTFIQTYHNIRYVLSLFGIVCVLFGVFWGTVFQELMKKYSFVFMLMLIALIFAGGNKIIRKPHVYYNPNMDFYGDVQIADYKSMYAFIKNNFNYTNIAMFNDGVDTESWYIERYSNAYFQRGITKPYQGGYMVERNENPAFFYGSLKDFLYEKSKYPSGILIVEDWHSMLPKEIKEYAEKNMRLEKRFEGLSAANGDNWPLEVYSWGEINKTNK